MAGDLGALRACTRLGRNATEVRGGSAGGPRIGEAQHRIQQYLLALR
jgi:hypothetical protein